MALDHVGDAAHVDDVRAKPDNHAFSLRMILSENRNPRFRDHARAFLRPRSMAARMNFTRLGQSLEHRLADQKMTDVEFDDLWQRRDRLRGRIVEPMACMHFKTHTCGEQRAVADKLPLGIGFAVRPSMSASHQEPVWISITGAPSSAAISICAGAAPMNSETRMPACLSSCTTGRELARCRTTSRPPSVVRSVRFSGTRQTACGLVLSAMRDHFLGRRHFEIERLVDLRLQPRHVIVANVTAILAQMRGDAVAAGRDRKLGRAHGIRMTATTRIADGGNVVDIDAEAKTVHALSLRTILSEDRFLTLELSPGACFCGIMH